MEEDDSSNDVLPAFGWLHHEGLDPAGAPKREVHVSAASVAAVAADMGHHHAYAVAVAAASVGHE